MVFDFEKYLGAWTFDRQISNGCTMSGDAVLTADGDGAVYVERGSLVLEDGQALDFSRTYFYQWLNGILKVFFDPQRQRLFLALNMSADGNTIEGSDVHFCGDDVYRSRYQFFEPNRFRTTHDVRGPRKAYISETIYWR